MNGYVASKLILSWAVSTFGKVALDPKERAMRLFEEAAEVAQAEGLSYKECFDITRRTYERPPGEPFKEVGGLLVTVYGYCAVKMFDPDSALETEVYRVLSKDPVAWREKHAEKVAAGTAVADDNNGEGDLG